MIRRLNDSLNSPAQRGRITFFLLVLLTLAVFHPVASHEFVNYDDPDYLTRNARIQEGLSWEGVKWAFTGVHFHMWHPLTTLSHLLDCQLFGLNPAAHHLGNVVIHGLTAGLLFLVLARLTGSRWRSAVVAALFALHPLRVESVAWASERKDVLSGLFWVLTIGAYVRYVRRPEWIRYGVLVGTYALAILTKPMVVTLPLALLLLDFWPLRRVKQFGFRPTDWNRQEVLGLLREKVPLLALSGFLSVVTFLAQTRGGAVSDLERFSLGSRFANALVGYVTYLKKLIWPADLAVLYPHPGAWPAGQVLAAAAVLGVITFAAVRFVRRAPWLAVGWLWFLGTLVPVIGLVQAGDQAMADRYSYIPTIGIFMVVVWGVAELFKSRPRWRPALAVIAVLTLLVCAVATRLQLRHWANSERLFTRAIAVTRNNAVAHNNLGIVLAESGRVEEARHHYEEALRLKPSHFRARNNLGNLFAAEGDLEEAIRHYSLALQSRTNFTAAHYNLGLARMRRQEYAEAIPHLQTVLREQPNNPAVHLQLGRALFNENRIPEAVAYYQKILQVEPLNAQARKELGLLAFRHGRMHEALQHFQILLQQTPDDAEVNNYYGIALAQMGETGEAARHFAEALRLKPDYVEARSNLGNARLLEREPAEAIAHYHEALRLAPERFDLMNLLARVLATYPDPRYRNGSEAVRLAQAACQSRDGKQPAWLDTLAAAYAEAGEFQRAISTGQKALELARQRGDDRLSEEIAERLRLYRAGEAYEEHRF